MTDRPSLQSRLLAEESQPVLNTPAYRHKIEMMMEKEINLLARERRMMHFLWPFLVLMCTAFLVIGGYATDPTTRLWFGILACFWFLFGTTALLRYFLNRNRVEVLRELKELRLEFEALREKMER